MLFSRLFIKYILIVLFISAALIPLIINADYYVTDLLWRNHKFAASTFFYSTLWGGIFIYLNNARDKKLPTAITALGCVLIILAAIYHSSIKLEIFKLATLITLLCYLSCVICGSLYLLRKKIAAQTIPLAYFFMPLFMMLTIYTLPLTVVADAKVDNQLLYAIDATLGFYPTFFFGKLFALLTLWPQIFLYIIYATLPFAWAVVYFYRYKMLRREPIEFFLEITISAIAGIFIYHLIPAYSPVNLFSGVWPWHASLALSNPSAIFDTNACPRNCMPSLHAAVAYFIWRHAQNGKHSLRITFTVWLLLLLLSTVMLGQHYLIDIIVAFAFAVAIRGVCAVSLPAYSTPRLQAILIGTSLCGIWFLLIFFGLPLLRWSPVVPWILYGSTIIIACSADHKLSRAQACATQIHHSAPACLAVSD
jgi:hypothetical protein